MFSVHLKENPNRFMGAIALYNYDQSENSYEVGRLILDSKNMPRREMGDLVVGAVCHIAFNALHADLLRAEILQSNTRSIRCFRNNGFYPVGSSCKSGPPTVIVELHKDFFKSKEEQYDGDSGVSGDI